MKYLILIYERHFYSFHILLLFHLKLNISRSLMNCVNSISQMNSVSCEHSSLIPQEKKGPPPPDDGPQGGPEKRPPDEGMIISLKKYLLNYSLQNLSASNNNVSILYIQTAQRNTHYCQGVVHLHLGLDLLNLFGPHRSCLNTVPTIMVLTRIPLIIETCQTIRKTRAHRLLHTWDIRDNHTPIMSWNNAWLVMVILLGKGLPRLINKYFKDHI